MMEGDDNSFSPVERLIGSSRKDGGKRISNMRSSQQISRKISLEHPKDVDISARKLTNQYHLASTERSIALTGGLKLSKEGSVYIKLSGFTGWFAGWQKKTLCPGKRSIQAL
uniref:Uncharacterized protein n=1 Tax=Aplanochytrium stocchinoi TaxID=215587 RepID=A0A7S3LT28_9STRA|mmetsp:Transcript_16041/g.20547  ORF Transcript_16041/g.20547 Transcript_16041/m.20547 type:complete len:112 (+) Transcript_16041:61-396(+)